MTDDDAALLGQSRGAVCVTATGDRELGTGVISLDALRNNGARIVVGTAIGAVIDPFLELRTMEGHARLSAGRRPVLSPAELLRSATTDGTIALGWRDAGLLASGQRADLVTVSLHTPRMAGTDPDAVLAHLTSSATAADITHVTVNGELIAEHGMHRSGDVTAMLEAALAAVR
jgi:cytosine/adenosine deaminase-related metal-dependent hydrolase